MSDAAQKWRGLFIRYALTFIAISLPVASACSREGEAGRLQLSFLSGSEDGTRTGPGNATQERLEQSPVPPPQGDNADFDGVWTFTSAGCPYTGSLLAKIVGGKIIVKGGSGQVDRDGTCIRSGPGTA